MKRPLGATDLLLDVDPSSRVPLYRQVYRATRDAILEGRLAPGTRIPSTRTLAADLGLSRNTMLTAFELLAAEGYLEGRVGAGTTVSNTIPRQPPRPRFRATTPSPAPLRKRSRRASAFAALPRRASQASDPAPRAFRPGVPAIDAFPVALWGRIASRRWRASARDLLDYGDTAGFRPLRRAIAHYVGASRGVRCSWRQVVVVAGSQQAIDLASRVLLDPGDAVWIEDPGYHGARGALTAAEARIVPVEVDSEGLAVERGIALCADARLVHVSPSHQFPLGVTMSLARRLALLRWASGAGAWILEDDYDSEFRYGGRPLSALQGLDADGRVIYVGTFSKVLFPSLRLGYLIVPEDLFDAFLAARMFADTHSPLIEQAVLADFIEEGHFERHVRRMRALYHERQELLVAAARREMSTELELEPTEAGMHLIGWLPRETSDVEASRAAALHGVDAIPLSFFRSAALGRPGLVLGYAGLTSEEIREGVVRLSRALRSRASAAPNGRASSAPPGGRLRSRAAAPPSTNSEPAR